MGALNTCSIGANSRSCQNNALLQFNKQHKINFFNWLANSPASGGTPLHAALDRAGRFLQTNGTAYTTEDGKTYSCRASYHIMMTDGIWNGRNVTPGNLDNQNQTFPDSTLYRPQPLMPTAMPAHWLTWLSNTGPQTYVPASTMT